MNTANRIRYLAAAIADFPFLGPIGEKQLLEVVRAELGHEEILDDFCPYAGALAKAVGPGRMLHVLSGNTPHAGLQSLIRGLILGAKNLCKIPSDGLPEMEEFRNRLPPEMAALVEISRVLEPGWLESADAVVVFGDDPAIEYIRSRTKPGQKFAGHGHRVSFGIVFDDPGLESAALAAKDTSLFDQQGCLSPHLFYVREPAGSPGFAREYADALAREMERFNRNAPRTPLSAAEAAVIAGRRAELRFVAANDGIGTALWESERCTDWTVVFETDSRFTPSIGNRFVFVKPLPVDLAAATAHVRPWLSAAGIWPWNDLNARAAARSGASRICRIGSMQTPAFTWHQDGGQTLAPFVDWIDFEPPAGF